MVYGNWKRYLFFALVLITWIGIHIYGQFSRQIPLEIEGKTISVEGAVMQDPIIKENSLSFLFHTQEFGLIQLDWYRNAPEIKRGDYWQFSVRLKRPRNYNNPGGFNYERFLFFKRISGRGYIDVRGDNQLISTSPSTSNIRLDLASKIDTVLAERSSAALIKGLAVGIRDTMTPPQWELLQKTGTSHLLAISGLHIGLVSGLVYFLVLRLWALGPHLPLWIPAPKVAAIVAIIAALGYCALAGFAIPTQRAVIMIMVLMWCKITYYQFKSNQILILAAVVVILWDPFALFSASFWLSFLAVGLLILLGRQQAPKWYYFLSVQGLMSLGLTPLVIFYFQQISWVSPIANFLAIPWASFFVVPFTLLGVVASFIDIRLATFFWLLAESALDYLQWFLETLAHWPWSAQFYAVNDFRVGLCIILASLLFLLPRAVPGKLLAVVLLGALIFIRSPQPKTGEVWLTVLDVGQGLAVVVQTKDHVLLYDAAMRFDTFDLGEAVIVPFLRHQGIKKIDTLVLSHDNLDHTGGAQYIIEHMPVNKMKSGEEISGIKLTSQCLVGQSWQWDGVNFEFLYPPASLELSSNDSSCVLKITTGEYSALLTGDIEKQGETWLTEHARHLLKTNILLAPHHGSRTSSSVPFVQATDPNHVVFSTGYLNRYNFPNKIVLARYVKQGVHIHNTAEVGAISFSLDPTQGISKRL